MSVWFAIPSKRPPAEAQPIIDLWRRRGYKVAIWRDMGDAPVSCDLMLVGKYQGYSKAVNELCRQILKPSMAGDWLECHGHGDLEAQWIVTGGDDTEPDPNHTADEIGQECSTYFHARNCQCWQDCGDCTRTFGVMQPTGDRFAGGSIDRIAGSPWIGREFALRVNGGRGPYWPEYTHMFVDEEIMEVAVKLGVFWQRRDLTHLHHHFMRKSNAIDSPAIAKPIPAHLREANSPEHWNKYHALFSKRKREGFPGHEPLLAVGA